MPWVPEMPVRRLKPSRVLGVERCSDFDEFRANEVLGLGTSTPLRPREFSLSRAILPLRDGLFVLQRSFARRFEAEIGTDNGVGLVVPLTFHSIANGREVDSSMIAVMRGKAPVKAIEHHPNTYLMLRFNSDMRHRGWADFDTGLAYVRTQDEPMTRTVVSKVQVLTAGTKYDQEKSKSGEPIATSVVTVAVLPEDAERIALASNEGKITLALRNPLDIKSTDTRGIKLNALMKGTGPEPVVDHTHNRVVAKVAPPAPPAPPVYTVEAIRAAKRSAEVVN